MKIICVGRNYADHARELNNPLPTEPVIFLKPETAIPPGKNPFFLPSFSNDVHYEAELVVRINRLGKNIEEKFAHKYYSEITVGIDFTARDLQKKLKEQGLPWEKAKAFDGSAPVGKFLEYNALRNTEEISFDLEKNGQLVQRGLSSDMIFSIDALIAYVSKYFTLKIGDLIFTGTPAGVGPVSMGDHLVAHMAGRKVLDLKVR